MAKKLTALLLASLILASAAACAEQTAEDKDVSVTTDGQTKSEADGIDFSSMSFIERIKYTNSAIDDNLPNVNYDGAKFIIYSAREMMATDYSGEVLDDAEYEQKTAIEERFGVKVEYVKANFSNGWDGYIQGMQTMFFAGDYFADIVQNWNTSSAGFVMQEFYLDLSMYEAIDTSKPWYFGDEMNLYSHNGHMYLATGFMNTDVMLRSTSAILFNKNMAAEYNVENLYDVVRAGDWTLEYVTPCARISTTTSTATAVGARRMSTD